MSINQIVSSINNLSIEEKSLVYTRCFGFGTLASSDKLNDKIMLISLVGLTASKLKEKNKELTTLDILVQITRAKKGETIYEFITNLAIIVDDLSYLVNEFDSCGFTESKQIIEKIRELINSWVPF